MTAEIIAFTGTHCTGKTTLKLALAGDLRESGFNVHVLEFSVGDVSKEIGIHCGSIPEPEDRMALQNELLKRWVNEIADVVGDESIDFIICDRCPLDFMIYPNMESTGKNEEYQMWLNAYNRDCKIMLECVDYMFLTPLKWFISAEDRDTRGVIDVGYMQSCDYIARGVFQDIESQMKSNTLCHMIRYKTVEDRISEVINVISA